TKGSLGGSGRVSSTSITSNSEVRSSFRRCVNSIWRAIVAKRKDSYYRAPRSLCGIGSKSRILSIARQKGVTSCLIGLQTDTVQGQATTYTVGRDHRVSLEAASSVIQISGAPQ